MGIFCIRLSFELERITSRGLTECVYENTILLYLTPIQTKEAVMSERNQSPASTRACFFYSILTGLFRLVDPLLFKTVHVVAFAAVFAAMFAAPAAANPSGFTAAEPAGDWKLLVGEELRPGLLGARLVNSETGIQAPILLDPARLENAIGEYPLPEWEGWWLLHEGSLCASAPFSFGPGRLAYLSGTELFLLDLDGRRPRTRERLEIGGCNPLGEFRLRASRDLGCEVQHIAVSPGFEKVAYTDYFAAAVKVMDLETGVQTTVIEDFEGIPAWSSGGELLAVVHSGLGVRLVDVDTVNGCRFIGFHNLENGFVEFGAPVWSSSETDRCLLHVSCRLVTGRGPGSLYQVTIDPLLLDATGSLVDLGRINSGIELSTSNGASAAAAVVTTDNAEVTSAAAEAIFDAAYSMVEVGKRLVIPPLLETASTGIATSRVGGVPFIHQVYDSPDWFDGNWACGPTSCLMSVQKYKKLPYWLCRASWPYGHTSFWGNYIAGQFTHSDVTYSSVSYDPSGRPARGLYGYICPGGYASWDRMNNFLQWAGCSTYYDSSPTWSELTAQLDAGRPVVMSTMLTEYGHIVTATGYYSNHSVIVRDPYGNKASGYPNYESSAVYDWPGYNNGNYNLNSVSLLIGVSGSSSGLAAIIDDETSNVPRCRFERNGPPEWFWESDYYGTGSPGAGHAYTNGMIYTYSEPSGGWTNWVAWGVNITKAGNYKFEVFIPQNLATTTNAEYYHYHSATGQSFMKSVNQNIYYDDWVTLDSSYYCRTGWNYILLGDVTGESTAKMIGIDAIRVTQR